MRQFFETYRDEGKVVPPVRQLPWTHNLIIMGQSKRPEEREFYLRLAAKENWSKRELERQVKAALFERTVLYPVKVSPPVRQMGAEAVITFKDSYVLEFLGLQPGHDEADLHRGLLQKLRMFLTELGRDFCYMGSEVPIQVGGRDFALDLLFFHRGLNCMVAIELKVGRFEPEYLGKLSFYLEALDRDVRKDHEQPSIGVLLCASKEDEVVEYTLSRRLSPALIAESRRNFPTNGRSRRNYTSSTCKRLIHRRRKRPLKGIISRISDHSGIRERLIGTPRSSGDCRCPTRRRLG